MRRYTETLQQKQARDKLVRLINSKGITDPAVLKAIGTVPRHLFMTEDMESSAYQDRAFPIGAGQTISQPYTVAYQTQLLDVQPSDKILEIGTGSMYQACVLAAMGAEVYTIERQQKLFEKNKAADYAKTCSNVHLFYGDGFEGLPEFAPFDKILITAAAPYIPPKLIEQLKHGGVMVLPVGTGQVQTMMRVIKKESGELQKEHFSIFSFVPMLEGLDN